MPDPIHPAAASAPTGHATGIRGDRFTADGAGTADAFAIDPAKARRAIVASSVGNALEWFDIIVYATFAPVIGKLFFPPAQAGDSGLAGLLIAYGVFALSYLIRPLGAMVIGSYADRHGRKNALTLTIFTMMVGTLIMACAPTASMVGPYAGLFIVLSRLIQGFSAGGEFGSSTAYLVEHSREHKAFYGSFQVATQGASMLLASAFGLAMYTWITPAQLESWGWRVPFLFGLLIGPVGMYIRAHMDETPDFVANADRRARSPLGQVFVNHWQRWLTAAGTVGLASLSVYLLLTLPSYAVRSLKLPAEAGFLGGMVAGTVTLIGSPFVGRLADRVGPARVMTGAAAAGLVLVFPLFLFLIANPSLLSLTLVQTVLGVLMALYFAPLPALMASIYPTEIRATGMSLSYNAGVTLFGGLTPYITTRLAEYVSSGLGPAWWYVTVALISLVALTIARRSFGQR